MSTIAFLASRLPLGGVNAPNIVYMHALSLSQARGSLLRSGIGVAKSSLVVYFFSIEATKIKKNRLVSIVSMIGKNV